MVVVMGNLEIAFVLADGLDLYAVFLQVVLQLLEALFLFFLYCLFTAPTYVADQNTLSSLWLYGGCKYNKKLSWALQIGGVAEQT